MPVTPSMDVPAAGAVAFRVAAHGLDERQATPSAAALRAATRVALPDYPRGAALRSLAARCDGVADDTLDRAVARGTLVRAPSLRGTAHVFAADDAATWTAGVLPAPGDEDATRAALGSSWPVFDGLGVPAVEALARVADEIAGVAADGRPRPKGAVSEALHDRLPDGWEPWCARCEAHHVPDLLFRLATVVAGLRFAGAARAEMVAGPPPDRSRPGHAAARVDLARRYVGAYAPAASRAFAEWCGLGPAEAAASFDAMGDEVVGVQLDGQAAVALAGDADRLASPPPVTGVRLVPAGDPFLHQRDRATLLPHPDHRRRLWRPAGAPGLVLVDGRPAGTWRHKQDRKALVVAVELWSAAGTPGLVPTLAAEAATVLTVADPDRLRLDVRSDEDQ